MRAALPVLLLVLLLLGACSSPKRLPSGPPAIERDGPEAVPPPDLLLTPDPVPRIEPIRLGGPNKPYEIDGQRFEPIAHDEPFKERGLASWYGRKFHGRPTANGETYNMYAMSAAHKLMPLPSYARVRNPANGREVIVRVNDRGPFARGRVIDLSYTAALKLDLLRGVAPVEVERITFDEIRAGLALPPAEALTPPAAAEGAVPVPSTQDLRTPAPQGLQALPPAEPEVRAATRGLWLQLGAFRARAGAEALIAELGQRFPDMAPKFTLFRDRGLHRVQLGPLADRELAQRIAQRLREEGALESVLVSR
ncbi:septal ring lytic transglycosylase RlpA family protein [Inhella sp.]|uniref:septal ring lytic transglycosylase RlpA family protein n=1 Tax=Inhella sp. TaxID=1921806 RepID=UPI0035B0CC29